MKIAALAVALVAVLSACSVGDEAADGPSPAPSRPASSPTTRITVAPTDVTAGVEGLDIRYLDHTGRIKTLRVEDFPH